MFKPKCPLCGTWKFVTDIRGYDEERGYYRYWKCTQCGKKVE